MPIDGQRQPDPDRIICDQTCHDTVRAYTVYYNINIPNVKGSILSAVLIVCKSIQDIYLDTHIVF